MPLSDFITPVVHSAPLITIVGEAGVGKTTFASQFPNPIFIRAEDGLEAVNPKPAAMSVLASGDEIFQQLAALVTEEHNFKTVVIDSVTKLNSLFEKDVVDSDPKAKSINTANGGYGAGFTAVAEKHWRVKRAADALRKKGIAVIFIAHADIEKIDLPDLDPYSRYSVRLHKKSIAPYTDDVDLIGYLHSKVFVRENGKVTDANQLVLSCTRSASHISKNRYGITTELPLDFNELAKHIPFYSAN